MTYKQSKPWGYFEVIGDGPNHKTKQLVVMPEQATSLQRHKYRAEHWVVVSGTASVVRDHEVLKLATNESVYIHVGQKHRLANETDAPLTVIEVQTGEYLGEDDIVRYDDVYLRHN